ncbi:MAG: hypothetical protein IJM59_11650 [Proteobacteria bacterium]|nr:hypothetical protein [Pseudomonadota bacterium]
MRSESSFTHRFRIDLIILLILFVIGLGTLLHHFPVTISSNDATGTVLMPLQLGQSGTLLILPDTPENAETFSGLDFSFAWYNLLTQYVGTFGIAQTRDIQSASAMQAQLIVVPQRSAESMSESQIQIIAQAVQKGATLIVEMPTPEWAPLTAIKRRTKVNTSIKHFTDATNSPLSGTWRDHLLNTPLDTQVMRLDALDSETLATDAMLLELDGAIAHYKRPLGAGTVFVLAFNLGQALTALEQGRPSESFAIEVETPPKTSDLVMNEKLRTSTVPYADLLKNHLILSTLYVAPMPIIWPFPESGKAALIVTHETGMMDDQAFGLAEYERSLNMTSTWLTTAGKISKKTLDTWKNAQFDIGVSLLRPPVGRIYEPYGLPFFQPVVVERSMTNQMNAVVRRLGAKVTSCRIAGSAWDPDYTYSFRKLTAAECQIDMSYAPTAEGEYGYLFGSGFPFLPIERNGLPLPSYEFPVLINDEVGLESLPPHAALKMLTESEATWHEPVHVLFNADTMLQHPSHVSPESWLELLQYAQDNQIWVTSAKDFMHYYTLRKQTRLSYAFHPQTKVLDARIILPNMNRSYTVGLPRRTAYGTIHDVWVNKTAQDVATLKTTGDGALLLISVPSGEHLVQAQYQ